MTAGEQLKSGHADRVSAIEFYSDSRAGDVRFRSIDFRLRPAGVPQGGWCHKGCQNIAILMRISDMYSNLP